MSKRQNQKRMTRTRIRESARVLFESQGYEDTTSRQIAQEAGVALGTIFTHFSHKQAILADILFEALEETVAQAFQTLPSQAPALDKILHLAETLYRYYAGNLDLSRTLLSHSLLNVGEDRRFSQQVEGFLQAVGPILKGGQESGEIAPGKDLALLTQIFMANYFMVLVAFLRGDIGSVEEAVTTLRALMTQVFS